MILVIAGTDRVGSNSAKIARQVQGLITAQGGTAEVLDLATLKPASLGGPHYGAPLPESLGRAVQTVDQADAIYLCVPEYNGSMPGALKYFIDHWKYPDSFEFRPFALTGLGGTFGGLRPVEHVQGVLGYRNAFLYPERVFIRDAGRLLKETDKLNDPFLLDLLQKQVKGFMAFVTALKAAGLDANSRRRS